MSGRALCLFAQSLPLSVASRARPNPSTPCRQPTHHIQMAYWPTHTRTHTEEQSSMETVCYRTKDTLLILPEQHPSSEDLLMCQLDGSDTPSQAFILTSGSHTL